MNMSQQTHCHPNTSEDAWDSTGLGMLCLEGQNWLHFGNHSNQPSLDLSIDNWRDRFIKLLILTRGMSGSFFLTTVDRHAARNKNSPAEFYQFKHCLH